MKNLRRLRPFSLPLLLTLLIAGVFLSQTGFSGLWIFTVLVILEVTLSFDNAVVNSRVLRRLSVFWQQLFLTVGIIVAVFIVRFLLPIVIVAATTSLTLGQVIHAALYDPAHYSDQLESAMPLINSFGGVFLLLVGLTYFVDRTKTTHWLGWIETPLKKLAHLPGAAYAAVALMLVVIAATLAPSWQWTIFWAGLIALVTFALLHSLPTLLSAKLPSSKAVAQTGVAALVSFLYLEVLDASFSLDSVIGAFALTSDIWLIVAGLGIGALWVRSLTVYMVRTDTLTEYRYLEHGAHWAIAILGGLMLVKLYGVDVSEWLIGGAGIAMIGLAVISSLYAKKQPR